LNLDEDEQFCLSYLYSERIRVREQRAEELAEKRLKIVLDAERAKRKDMMNDGEDEWVSSMLLHQEKIKVEVAICKSEYIFSYIYVSHSAVL
jgi:septum formation topological specificity factor MinE